MKYIDVDKLIAEIEKKKEILVSEYNELAKYEVWKSANDKKIKINTIGEIISLIVIASIQQEQPEVDLEKELKNLIKNSINGCSNLDIANHFYELGRNARKE